MSSTTTQQKYKVDDEIRPTVEALQEETSKLLELSKEIYVPSRVADTVIGEVLPVRQQLLLYVVSAHVALSSMFCQKKLANEPIPEKLTQQIIRVQGYLKKLKEHGIDLTKQQEGGLGISTTATTSGVAAKNNNNNNKLSGNRRERDAKDNASAEQVFEDSCPQDTEEEKRKRRVDPAVAARVGKMAQQQQQQ